MPCGGCDWPQREVLEAWCSPYFDWSQQILTGGDFYTSAEEVAARLADVVRDARIVGGLDQWRTALAQRVQISQEDSRVQEQGWARIAGPLGEEAAALNAIFEAFIKCVQPPEKATLTEYIAFVEDLIGDDPRSEFGRDEPLRSSTDDSTPSHSPRDLQVVAMAIANSSTAERDETALQAFKDALRGLRLAAARGAGGVV